MCIRTHEIVIYNTQLQNNIPSWRHKPSVWQSDFTITGVNQHIKYDTSYISPPFYTHENGYKVRLEVYPSGLDDGVEMHVSIYFRLLQGEYDHNLKWPINVQMQVKILNWCKDDTHIMNYCHISADTRVNGLHNEASSLWGLSQFCAQSILLTASEAINYVEDDCMCVSIIQS